MFTLYYISILPENISKSDVGVPQTSKIERFGTVFNGLKLLTIVVKCSILDICGSPGYYVTARPLHGCRQCFCCRQTKI